VVLGGLNEHRVKRPMIEQNKPRSEELSVHLRMENSTILCGFLVAFVLAVMIGLILRFAINATP
jgi:hypothetical protein